MYFGLFLVFQEVSGFRVLFFRFKFSIVLVYIKRIMAKPFCINSEKRLL